jgi:hypothetical protein
VELTDKEIHLLAQLSRDRGLYAECKGADLDALRELGLLQWFDARSSTTPFKEDPRPLFRLLLFSGRIDYFWVAPVENWPGTRPNLVAQAATAAPRHVGAARSPNPSC